MILAIAFLVTVGLLNMGCVDEDLWEEVGDEVPAAWEDSLGSSKSKGKPVPPGDYFTVIKGCHPVSSLSSYPILLFVLLACSHLVMACKGCTSAYPVGIGTQGNTLAACPTTHLFNATATETGFTVAPALCCYGKTCVTFLVVPQDLYLLLADACCAHTLGNDS